MTTLLAGVDAPRAIVAGLSGLVFALSIGPRNERAIFVVPDIPAAFAALTPTPNPVYTISFGGPGGLGGFAGPGGGSDAGVGSSGSGPGGGIGSPFGTGEPIGSPIAGFLPDSPFGPFNFGSVPGLGAGGNTPGSGVGVPAVPFPQPVPGTGADPVESNPQPTPPDTGTTPPIVVPAVPEPTTWAMMIAGFAMIGIGSRRRRRRGKLSDPMAIRPSR